MYNHNLIFEDQMFEDGMTTPANTNADADAGLRVGPTAGKLGIKVLAGNDSFAVASGQTMTISYKIASTESGSYAFPAKKQSMVYTVPAGGLDQNTGEEILSMPIPPEEEGKWIKPNIATTDATAAGTIDVVLDYHAG